MARPPAREFSSTPMLHRELAGPVPNISGGGAPHSVHHRAMVSHTAKGLHQAVGPWREAEHPRLHLLAGSPKLRSHGAAHPIAGAPARGSACRGPRWLPPRPQRGHPGPQRAGPASVAVAPQKPPCGRGRPPRQPILLASTLQVGGSATNPSMSAPSTPGSVCGPGAAHVCPAGCSNSTTSGSGQGRPERRGQRLWRCAGSSPACSQRVRCPRRRLPPDQAPRRRAPGGAPAPQLPFGSPQGQRCWGAGGRRAVPGSRLCFPLRPGAGPPGLDALAGLPAFWQDAHRLPRIPSAGAGAALGTPGPAGRRFAQS